MGVGVGTVAHKANACTVSAFRAQRTSETSALSLHFQPINCPFHLKEKMDSASRLMLLGKYFRETI